MKVKDNFLDRLQGPLMVKIACLHLFIAVIAALMISPLVSFAKQGAGTPGGVVTASFIDINQSPIRKPIYPHDTNRKDLKIGDILDLLTVSGQVITGKYTGNNLVTISNKSLKLIFPKVLRSAPILDLQPLSMSFIGSRDCQGKTTFICQARVSSRKSAQGKLHWMAYVDFPGHVVFDPPSGSLAPGKDVIVTIKIPLNACKSGLFYFQGPVNTHTITWACKPVKV
jgi:hypothetical protein